MTPNTATQIAGRAFANCIMNAAGVCDYTRADLDAMQNSSAASFVTKSATVSPREGNPEPRYRDTAWGSINSMGLPNFGLPYYLNYVSQAQQEQPEKTYFVSISGFSAEDDIALMQQIYQSDFNGIIELNLSCPNVVGSCRRILIWCILTKWRQF